MEMGRCHTGDVFYFHKSIFDLPRTYTAYLGPIRLTLDNMDFTLDNMDFNLDNMNFTLDYMNLI